MPIKIGNINQSKVGNSVAATTVTAFTLPAQAQIISVAGYGTITGAVTIQARPINLVTPVTIGTVSAAQAAVGGNGDLTGVLPYDRQSVPVVITLQGATTGNIPVRVEYM